GHFQRLAVGRRQGQAQLTPRPGLRSAQVYSPPSSPLRSPSQAWGIDMRRREFIKGAGSAAAAWPFHAGAQQISTPGSAANERPGVRDNDARFADVVVSGGTILTQDPLQPTAQALAVKGEHIFAVGAASDIALLRGPQTRSIDAAGRTVLPGI